MQRHTKLAACEPHSRADAGCLSAAPHLDQGARPVGTVNDQDGVIRPVIVNAHLQANQAKIASNHCQ